MNIRELLWEAARSETQRALPILSFPAVQKMDATVEQLVKDAELQAQAMEIVARDTDTLAAVSLMDLSVEAEAFGAKVRFAENEVPAVMGQLVADEDDADALGVPDLEAGRAKICAEGVRLAKQRIRTKPVLAGMIGPYSLAGRLMDVTEILYICYDEPETVHKVLEKATAYLIRYGGLLKETGAGGIVLAEPLAGILSPDMAEEFSVPYVKRIIEALQDENFGVIYHNCGDAVNRMVPQILETGAAAYHFGNAVSMEDMLRQMPGDVLTMGNVDPVSAIRNGTPEKVRQDTLSIMDACCKYPNFLISSGCDIPPAAPWENIDAFFAAVEEFYHK